MTEQISPHGNNIIFQQNGSPFSEQFNDIYFDSKTGYHQNRHVFIDGNKITERLSKLNLTKQELKSYKPFIIAEAGFGTGLNVLLTLQAYQKVLLSFGPLPVEPLTLGPLSSKPLSSKPLPSKLLPSKPFFSKQSGQKSNTPNDTNTNDLLASIIFISIEKYPLSKTQLTQSLSIFPELKEFSDQLIAQYPDSSVATHAENSSNEHQLSFFNGKFILKLIFSDAEQALAKISIMNKRQNGKADKGLVDAWYIDGFSPEKNPEMWSEKLFEQIARLSKEQATLSTFTVSGKVRQQLKQVGFRITKQTSNNDKKEITTGVYQQNHQTNLGYQLRSNINKPQQVSIIGGGIASACAAYILTQHDIKVTLYCKDNNIAQGASSNATAALYPLLHQQQDDISLFYQQAFWRAKSLYQKLHDDGYKFCHDWCGLLEVSYKTALEKRQKSFEKINAWPENLIKSINKETASNISGIPLKNGGLFMPNAGWIAPQELVEQLFKAAADTNKLRIETNIDVNKIQHKNDKWQLSTNKGELTANILIICGGAETIKLNIIDQLPLTSVRGQVTSMKTNSQMKNLSTVLCHKGYLTPSNNEQHCIGATFEKNSFDTTTKTEDDEFNLEMLNKCLPELENWTVADIAKSKARLRCMTPDHLPMVGSVPDIDKHKDLYQHLSKDKNWPYNQPAPVIKNLYVMTGFGARGLCSAPLLADILAADLCGTPYPVDNKLLFNLAPNRFVIRDLIRSK